MKIFYVSRVTDPNEYDELLRETISAALAADIAYGVTSSNPVTQNMYQLFQDKLRDARFVDATEGTPGAIDNCLTISYSAPCDDTDNDGICDDVDDCVGEYDECGVCNGDGIADGACDCAGNVEDCAGVCGGDSVEDECGECI